MTIMEQHKPQDCGCLHSQLIDAPPIRRLSEAAAWDAIPAAFQRRISMIAVAYAVAAMEQAETGQSQAETTEARAFRAGEEALGQLLRAAIIEAVRALRRSTTPPMPKLLGWVCRSCGCADHAPCAGGCRWIAPDLCSACTGPGVHASKEAGADLPKHITPRSSRTIQEFPHAKSQKESAREVARQDAADRRVRKKTAYSGVESGEHNENQIQSTAQKGSNDVTYIGRGLAAL